MWKTYRGNQAKVFNRSERTLMLVTDRQRQWYMQVENGDKFYFMASVHNRYVTRLVLKHRILVFKLDFKLDLLQMTLNFMLLQDSCMLYELDPK